MAFLDSEQMWRMANQKRSLSKFEAKEYYTDSDSEYPEVTTSYPSPFKPLKASRISQTTCFPPSSPTKRFCCSDHNAIECHLPPCNRNPPRFADLGAYEEHHKQVHTLVCIECHLHFPTERFLSLHIEERHDPFVEAQRAKNKYKVHTLSLG